MLYAFLAAMLEKIVKEQKRRHDTMTMASVQVRDDNGLNSYSNQISYA